MESLVRRTYFFKLFNLFKLRYTGGASVLLVGIYSYISDVTAGDSMLYRFGLINLSLQLGNALGTVASGQLVG